MFCKKCGNEVKDGTAFCIKCGARLEDDFNNIEEVSENSENTNSHDTNSQAVTSTAEVDKKNNIISKIWNSPIFNKIAIKFGYILDVIGGVICIFLAKQLFKEGGFSGIGFGIIFAGCAVVGIWSGVTSFFSRIKDHELEENLGKKKRNLCIGVVVIVIALILLKETGGGTYYIVQQISFDNFGSETIGEIVDDNLKSPEWSQKKLDSGSKLVYVEGYSPLYEENMKITFYCEKVEDGYEVSLKRISFLDSDETYNDAISMAGVWASFYN